MLSLQRLERETTRLDEVDIVAIGCFEVALGCRNGPEVGLKILSCTSLDRCMGLGLMEEIVNGRTRADQRRIKHESRRED